MNAARRDSRPVAMLVLGMHRSGTSAAAGALRLLGVELGERLIKAADDNRKGYWEHAAAVDMHDQLLAGLSRSWDDVRRLPAGWQHSQPVKAARSAIRGIVAEFAGTAFWALKDPRLSRFTTLWLAELERARHVPACLFVIRHPDEVAASLQARNGLPLFASHLLWIRHVLEAARDTVDAPRAMITYDALLEDPCACLDRVAKTLDLVWPVAPLEARQQLTEFLDRAERHQVIHGSPESVADCSGLNALVRDMYAQCVEISEGSAGWSSLGRFEQVLDAFDTANHGWIEALGEIQQADAIMRGRVSQQLQERIVTLDAELSALDAAKAAAESLAHERLATLTRTEQRIAVLERLSLDRLAEAQRLTGALAETEKLGLDRLDEIQRLATKLDDANALALSRMEEMWVHAKAREVVEQLALERLAEIHRWADVAAAHARSLEEAHRRHEDVTSEIAALREQMDALKRSFAWKIATPVRAAESWIRRKGADR